MAVQDALKEDLAALEQEVLDEKLAGASHVPVHTPAGPSRVAGTFPILPHVTATQLYLCNVSTEQRQAAAEDDEEAQLRELQAALAMN
jgi:charged multivesicular body protein 4